MAQSLIEKTPLWLDIRKVFSSGKKPINFEYRGMLHTEKEDIPILKIISIDIVRDYINNIGDHIHLEFKMPLGDYMTKLYPYRTNLEFSIKKIQLFETGSTTDIKEPISIERFKAVFLPNENQVPTASELEMHNEQTLNRSNILDVKLQLLNRSLEPIRIKTVSGVFRQTNHKQLLNSLIAGESNKILVDGKPAIDGVDVVEPDNISTIQNIVIKDGTHITELATHIQDKVGGIYRGGIGNYLQTYKSKKLWFVYPIYDITRFKNDRERAIIYSIPTEQYPVLDRTYSQEANIITILANGEKKYTDSADTDYMNHGSGFRMPNANSFMKKPVAITEQGSQSNRARLNYETIIASRQDGLNYAPMVDSASSNPYKEYSKVIGRSLSRIDLVWQNGNPDLIYPGMPCKYIYLDRDKIVELQGIIVFLHSYTAIQGQGINQNSYKTQCQLTILAEKANKASEIPTYISPGVF